MVLAMAAATAQAAPPCPAPPGFDARGRIELTEVVVLYRTVPPAIEVGRHFAVEALVCARRPRRSPPCASTRTCPSTGMA